MIFIFCVLPFMLPEKWKQAEEVKERATKRKEMLAPNTDKCILHNRQPFMFATLCFSSLPILFCSLANENVLDY